MTVNLTSINTAVSAQPIDLITAALYEIGALAQGESPTPEDSAWLLQKLQRLIDSWNVQRDKIFTAAFPTFTMPANQQPISIGPGGTFAIPQRPVKLLSAAILLVNGDGTSTDLPLNIQDADWWANQRIKNLTSTLSTNVYYEADNPLGQLFFWPISSVSYTVRLQVWTALSQAIDPVTPLAMPQGYWDALVYTLAVKSAPSFGRPVSSDLRLEQKSAILAITNNNAPAPRIYTAGGMPSSTSAGRTNDSFLTGEPW